MTKKIAAGNWKMNGTQADLQTIVDVSQIQATCDVILCPPATLLAAAHMATNGNFALGGQDCHAAEKGAHTGDISAQMLRDAGAKYVIVGHSERRTDHNETNATVLAKATAALNAGLTPIICIGETLAQREAGETLDIVTDQLQNSLPNDPNIVIAYEPVWAIGTGLVPTNAQIEEVHNSLRQSLITKFGSTGQDIPLLYGGSVKASNANDIFNVPNVDGALVGGASLTPQDFAPIVHALSSFGS